MDFNEYRKRGKEMVDYIADYLENIRDRRVFPEVKPGYMRNLLPDSAPLDGENWDNIIKDVERVIMPGVTHWQSPHMHAYFPALNSFPSLLGDMLADAINCLGFTWASSPACTELETIVMNWLGKMIGLPDEFLHFTSTSSIGGGVIQTTASESTLICLLAGRTQAIRRFHEKTPGFQDAEINARLVAYCSDQAHSSVEKAALIGLVRMRYIESDEHLSLRGKPLRKAVEEDLQQGLIPFWVCATLGTTGACAFDNLEEVGKVCEEYKLWLHTDAAYAGSAFLCPEYRIWLKGIKKVDSIAFNPSKWLMVHFDCTSMWVKNSTALHRTFNVEPLYLQHENSGLAIDYMHWQIPLSKRFRALKLWFVLRSFGIKGLQKHIRESVRLAQKFEALVLADSRFEIPAQRYLGLVVFRVKGENDLTEKLLKRLNHRGKIHCVPSSLKGKYVIRFTVTSTHTTNEDIVNDWAEIRLVTSEILAELNIKISGRSNKIPLKETRDKNEAFGSSLLLANCPMSPKIVNGSFAAIFDADEFLAKAYAGIRIVNQDSPSMRRRVRGILMSGKQFSLDSRMDLVVQGITSTSDPEDELDKKKSIKEDCEDNWEVCERSKLIRKLCTKETNQRKYTEKLETPKFLLPLQIPKITSRCHSKHEKYLNKKKRSSSMDDIIFKMDKIIKTNKLLSVDNIDYCYTDHKIENTNLYPFQTFSSSSIKTINNNINKNNYHLNSINEENVEDEDCDEIKYFMNFNPYKRQSEPSIRYSYINSVFEVNNTFQMKRNSLQENSIDNQSNIQVCVNNEFGHKIDSIESNSQMSSPVSSAPFYPISSNTDTPISQKSIEKMVNLDNFNQRKKKTRKFILKKEKHFDDYFSIEHDVSQTERDSFSFEDIVKDYEYESLRADDGDEVAYENIKFCKKCGHKSLKLN